MSLRETELKKAFKEVASGKIEKRTIEDLRKKVGLGMNLREIKRFDFVFVIEWNGEYYISHKVYLTELKNWMKDGSIKEGNIIVFPSRIKEVVLDKKLKIIEARE